VIKDKRVISLDAVPVSLWPALGKENWYFYTRHPNNNDRTYYFKGVKYYIDMR
jgi:hypothetical protein